MVGGPSFPMVSGADSTRRFSGDEAFAGNQQEASQQDAGVELGVVIEGKKNTTKL